MLNSLLKSQLQTLCSEALGYQAHIVSIEPVHGGDIHQSFALGLACGQCFFVKTNNAIHYSLLEQELLALNAIAATCTVKTPKVIGLGLCEDWAYLVLEHFNFLAGAALPLIAHRLLGEQLAKQHKACGHKVFGWPCDNYIGLTRQCNTPTACWADFWREHRLKPQIALAIKNGFGQHFQALSGPLLQASDILLATHQPQAALLHGDLWSGNKGFYGDEFTGHIQPVIFDPASYYGYRETDLAFTHLFGGFDASFYAGYTHILPLPEGFERRQGLYNLYHQLNHLNLLGDGYLAECLQAIELLLSA